MPLDAAGHVVELHAEAQVGFVRSVLLHRLDPRHPAERLGEVDAQHLAEHMLRPALEHFQHVLLLDERHFAVDLREFGLTVGAQILVAEAAHDLEIFVVTGHHEQLFERLRRLRQRIELVGIHAARHHEVARPLGRGLDQVGGFDFEESLPVEERAHGVRHPVPQDQRSLQRRPAQVEVAVFHTQVVAAVRLLLDREGRNVRAVEDHERIGRDLDLARGQLGILRLAFDDAARHLQDEFAAQFGGRPAGLFGRVLLDDDLRQAVAVAQVDEGHGAQVAHLLHPAGERHRRPMFAARSAPHVWVLYIIICIYCSVWLSLYLQLQDTKVRNLYEKRQCRQNFIGNHIPFYTAAPPKPDYRSGPRPKSRQGGGENLQTRLCHERSDSRPGAAARNPAGCKVVYSYHFTASGRGRTALPRTRGL